MSLLVTGAAGFIGSHLCEALLARGEAVTGLDNFHPCYDPALKRRNLEAVAATARAAGACFRFVAGDLRDAAAVARAVADADLVCHFAALAGVRPSVADPAAYCDVNVLGTTRLLETCRARGVRRVVFASSSSVYGERAAGPCREDDAVDHPASPYAATKRAGELLLACYARLHGFTAVALRLFTVYGPRGRPDLAVHAFTRLIAAGEPVPLFGDGSAERDFTWIADVVAGAIGAVDFARRRDDAFEIVNLGGARTTRVDRLIVLLEAALGRAARIERHRAQPGDVSRTCADVSKARRLLGYEPRTPIEEGIARYVQWFRGRSRPSENAGGRRSADAAPEHP